MPLKKGSSREVVNSNIHEMVRSGYKPKQAVAASLANARKYKKMAMGGKVDDDKQVDHMGYSHDDSMEHVNREPSAQTAEKLKGISDYFNQSYDDGGPVQPIANASPFNQQSSGGGGGGSSMMSMLPMLAMAANEGGMVEEGDDEGENHHEGLFELMKLGDQGEVANPQSMSDHQKLARALMKDEENDQFYAKGGLVEGPDGDEKPSNIVASDSEPMSSEPEKPDGLEHKKIDGVPMSAALSKEAIEAIKNKKSKRRYSR